MKRAVIVFRGLLLGLLFFTPGLWVSPVSAEEISCDCITDDGGIEEFSGEGPDCDSVCGREGLQASQQNLSELSCDCYNPRTREVNTDVTGTGASCTDVCSLVGMQPGTPGSIEETISAIENSGQSTECACKNSDDVIISVEKLEGRSCQELCEEIETTYVEPTLPPTEIIQSPTIPILSVPIPGFEGFDAPISKNGVITVNFIGQYLNAVYKYVVGFCVTLAIVMVMIGGLQYAMAGASGDVKKAQKRIGNAVAGLILLLFVATILFVVNPQISFFKPLNLSTIDPVRLIEESGDESGSVGITTEELADIGIICNPGGNVGKIAQSFVGKVTYRYGAKGNNPPYPDKKSCDDGKCGTYCPEGTLCADCSGFVGILAECAGISSLNTGGGTRGIFASAKQITSCTDSTITTEDGDTRAITPGDLVGFKAGDYAKSKNFGHVWMYIGNGQVINSTGSGRAPGSAIKIQGLTDICKTYPLRYVKH